MKEGDNPLEEYDSIMLSSLFEAYLKEQGYEFEQNDAVFEWVDVRSATLEVEGGTTINVKPTVYLTDIEWDVVVEDNP